MFNFINKINDSSFIYGLTESKDIVIAAQTSFAIYQLSGIFNYITKDRSLRLVNEVKSGVRPRMESKVFNFLYNRLAYNNLELLGYSVKKAWILRGEDSDEVYMVHLINGSQKTFEIYI